MSDNKNIACRIFKEQIDLVLALPEEDRAEVLYKAIISAFNQIENQNDNQIENQNENAYVSVSVSVSDIGKKVFNLLEKNIVCKEFSNNYGGKRIGAGKKSTQVIPEPKKETIVRGSFVPPTLEEVLEYGKQMNEMVGVGGFACSQEEAQMFYDYYSGIGWCLPNEHSTPIHDWKPFLRKWVKNPRKYAQKTPSMNVKEMKAAENHLKLQKMLNGEL